MKTPLLVSFPFGVVPQLPSVHSCLLCILLNEFTHARSSISAKFGAGVLVVVYSDSHTGGAVLDGLALDGGVRMTDELDCELAMAWRITWLRLKTLEPD